MSLNIFGLQGLFTMGLYDNIYLNVVIICTPPGILLSKKTYLCGRLPAG